LEEEFVVFRGGEGDFVETGVHVVGEVDLVLEPRLVVSYKPGLGGTSLILWV
jgi:hypothetical protein